MSTVTPITLPEFSPVEPIFRLSVEKYHSMVRSGILTEEDRVELLEGCLIPKMTKNPSHVFTSAALHELLLRIIQSGYFVNAQDPITTSDSEPEPDISVIRGTRRDFCSRHPNPADAALVVEVSDTTLARDQGVKKRIYARASVPVYWIINLVSRQIEIYSDPTGPAGAPEYRQIEHFPADGVAPVVIDGQEVGKVTVAQILP